MYVILSIYPTVFNRPIKYIVIYVQMAIESIEVLVSDLSKMMISIVMYSHLIIHNVMAVISTMCSIPISSASEISASAKGSRVLLPPASTAISCSMTDSAIPWILSVWSMISVRWSALSVNKAIQLTLILEYVKKR